MGALVNRSQRAITVATFRRAVMASDSRVMLNYRGSKEGCEQQMLSSCSIPAAGAAVEERYVQRL